MLGPRPVLCLWEAAEPSGSGAYRAEVGHRGLASKVQSPSLPFLWLLGPPGCEEAQSHKPLTSEWSLAATPSHRSWTPESHYFPPAVSVRSHGHQNTQATRTAILKENLPVLTTKDFVLMNKGHMTVQRVPDVMKTIKHLLSFFLVGHFWIFHYFAQNLCFLKCPYQTHF